MESSMVERLLLGFLTIIAIVVFLDPVIRRLRIIGAGKGRLEIDHLCERISRWFREVFFQGTVIAGRPLPGLTHALVFWAFIVFVFETADLYLRMMGVPFGLLGNGQFHLFYRQVVAVFAVLAFVGILYLFIRRFLLRPPALGEHLSWSSGLVSFFIMYLMVTYILGIYVFDEKTVAYKINAWLHILVILAFLDLIPRSKHLHLLFSLFTTFLKDFELARIKPLHLDLEADEETWELGAETLKDLSKFTALCAFTCVECGRCYDQCPARNTGKKLDPKQLMLDLRESYLKGSEKAFVEDELFNSVIWQCTTCGACTFQCPVGIDQVIPIIEMRRGSVANSVFPDTLRPLFDNLESVGNPWLYQPMDAATFLAENEFPDYEKGKVLYWMGCMARYDAEYRKVALAFKKLLDSAGVNWGVIVEETCTGDAARRAGNELLFQSLAGMNIEKLNEAAPELIVTTCPHCMRTLREYKDLGLKEDIRIIHHTQYLTDLISDGKLKIKGKGNGKVAYHDACYLSRYGDDKDYVNPRTLLRKAGVALTEPKRAKRLSFCCGAGGGMLFTEETEGTRVNHDRVDELLKTGMQTCATACPFCQMMIRDGLGDKGIEGMPVRDVAQILAECV
jgi:Fe-S oxidoreductase